MKMVCDDRTLAEVANEFLALKKAQKVRERTLNDYKKYIDKFLEQSQNSLDVDVLKIEILEYFADIPKTSPARFNHPYQYLHALFAWAAKQDYIPYNPFEKLELKKVRDEGNVQPAEIRDIQTLLKALDKHNYTELRDYNIVLLMLDTSRAETPPQGDLKLATRTALPGTMQSSFRAAFFLFTHSIMVHLCNMGSKFV